MNTLIGNILHISHEPLLVLDEELIIQAVNESFLDHFAYSIEQLQGNRLQDLDERIWGQPHLINALRQVVATDACISEINVEYIDPAGLAWLLDINAGMVADEVPGQKFMMMAVRVIKSAPAHIPEPDQVERYVDLIEAAQAIVYSHLPDGTLLSLNPAFEKILGWRIEDWIGQNWILLIHPEDWPEVLEKQALTLRGRQPVSFEVRALSLSGDYVDLEMRPLLHFGVGRELDSISGIAYDITDRKRAQGALLSSEERYRFLVDNAPDIIFTIAPNGVILSINPITEKILGWVPEELIGRFFQSYIYPEDVESVMGILRDLVSGDQVPVVEVRARCKSGAYLVIECRAAPIMRDGIVVGASGIARDVTERKRAQETIETSAQELKALFDAMTYLVFVFDRNGRYLRIAKSIPELLYKPAEELLGKTLYEIFPPEFAVSLHSGILQAIESQQVVNSEYSLTINGKEMWFSAALSPLYNDQALSVVQDITARKEAEAALRMSEDRYTLATSIGMIGIFEWDLLTGETYISPEAKTQVGIAPHEPNVSIQEWLGFIHPQDRETYYNGFVALYQGISDEFEAELRVIDRHKEERWVLLRLRTTVHSNDRPARITGAAIDVTERKRAELALRESEQKYRVIVDTTLEGIWVIDPHGKTAFANQRMADMAGCTLDEIMRSTIFDFIEPNDFAGTVQALENWKQGISAQGDYWIRRKDGSRLWVLYSINAWFDTNGTFIGALGMFTDINERKLAEEKLRETEERFATVFRASPIGIVIHKVNFGSIIDANDAWLTIFGYQREDVLGKTADEMPLFATEAEKQRIIDAYRTSYKLRGEEALLRTKTGEARYGLLSIDPITLQGEPCAVMVIQDITTRRQAEQQALELTLEREKMRLLESLITDTSHDLKTPVTVLRSSTYLLNRYIDMLLKQTLQLQGQIVADQSQDLWNLVTSVSQTTIAIHDHGDTIDQTAVRLQKLIENLLDMVRLDRKVGFEFIVQDINRIVAQAIDLQTPLAMEKNVALVSELQPTLPPVLLDEIEFARVMQNLIENAVNYTLAGGTVRVRTGILEHHIEIEVNDTGIGIEPEHQAHIFERFYRADRSRSIRSGGSGLGLSIALKIVEAHQGRIELESTPGQGSTFKVFLPIHLPLLDTPDTSSVGGR